MREDASKGDRSAALDVAWLSSVKEEEQTSTRTSTSVLAPVPVPAYWLLVPVLVLLMLFHHHNHHHLTASSGGSHRRGEGASGNRPFQRPEQLDSNVGC